METHVSLFDRIGGRRALIQLLNHFYADARQHQVLGPVFESQVENWPEHIGNIADFWTQIAGGPPRYSGQMPARHIPLGLREEHFRAWLGLWEINCRVWLPKDCADELISYALQIGKRLRQFCGVSTSMPSIIPGS
jgi:hemoglobin